MKYVKGDIFQLAEEGKFDYVIHGCNCFNTMGAGIARTVKDRYPRAYLVDQKTGKAEKDKLGHFTMAYIDACLNREPQTSGFAIINAYTQFGWWTRKDEDGNLIPNVVYDAVKNAFIGIKLALDLSGNPRFAIPKIGAGLAGGDWDRIEAIIDEIGFRNLTCVIYE